MTLPTSSGTCIGGGNILRTDVQRHWYRPLVTAVSSSSEDASASSSYTPLVEVLRDVGDPVDGAWRGSQASPLSRIPAPPSPWDHIGAAPSPEEVLRTGASPDAYGLLTPELAAAIDQAATQPITTFSLRQIYTFGVNRSEKNLLGGAQYLYQELPVRFAQRIKYLNDLPFGINRNPVVVTVSQSVPLTSPACPRQAAGVCVFSGRFSFSQLPAGPLSSFISPAPSHTPPSPQVRNEYVVAFKLLREMPRPETTEDELRFTSLIRHLLVRNAKLNAARLSNAVCHGAGTLLKALRIPAPNERFLLQEYLDR